MVQIHATYDGELRCTAVHPSGSELPTDAPKDNMGRGESFSPTDLVATSLVTCMMTTVAIVAQREGIAIGKIEATAVKNMVADPKRRIGSIPITMRFEGDFTDEQRRLIEKCARNCPVAVSIHPDIDVPLEIVWG